MYVNKCTKCGAEFETKNPKRVICPNCDALTPTYKGLNKGNGRKARALHYHVSNVFNANSVPV